MCCLEAAVSVTFHPLHSLGVKSWLINELVVVFLGHAWVTDAARRSVSLWSWVSAWKIIQTRLKKLIDRPIFCSSRLGVASHQAAYFCTRKSAAAEQAKHRFILLVLALEIFPYTVVQRRDALSGFSIKIYIPGLILDSI